MAPEVKLDVLDKFRFEEQLLIDGCAASVQLIVDHNPQHFSNASTGEKKAALSVLLEKDASGKRVGDSGYKGPRIQDVTAFVATYMPSIFGKFVQEIRERTSSVDGSGRRAADGVPVVTDVYANAHRGNVDKLAQNGHHGLNTNSNRHPKPMQAGPHSNNGVRLNPLVNEPAGGNGLEVNTGGWTRQQPVNIANNCSAYGNNGTSSSDDGVPKTGPMAYLHLASSLSSGQSGQSMLTRQINNKITELAK